MKKILVIEDEQPVRENLMDLLDAEDFDVLAAGDGKAGVELAQQHRPDLILCDVMMPKLDGFGVLSSLRGNPDTAMIPFIFLTAKADKNDLRQGMELGADDYLTKPFTVVELLGAISVRFKKKATIEKQSQQQLEQLRNSIALSLPHEMRTPLTNILGFSELLTDCTDVLEKKEIKEMSGMIHKSAQRLSRHIQNFLLYAELELIATDEERIKSLRSGRTSSVSSVVEKKAISHAKQVRREADLQLQLEDASLALGKSRLGKIVEELIDNAFKYSEAGSLVQVVGTTSENSSLYELSFTNSGRGLSATQIIQVGAYQQFERKLYEREGSGLGLVISKKLVQLLGGELIIESTPNKQTTVRVLLPL
ncbi:MAG: response regulator [Coleofasciculaceae cyanobacterium]